MMKITPYPTVPFTTSTRGAQITPKKIPQNHKNKIYLTYKIPPSPLKDPPPRSKYPRLKKKKGEILRHPIGTPQPQKPITHPNNPPLNP